MGSSTQKPGILYTRNKNEHVGEASCRFAKKVKGPKAARSEDGAG